MTAVDAGDYANFDPVCLTHDMPNCQVCASEEPVALIPPHDDSHFSRRVTTAVDAQARAAIVREALNISIGQCDGRNHWPPPHSCRRCETYAALDGLVEALGKAQQERDELEERWLAMRDGDEPVDA